MIARQPAQNAPARRVLPVHRDSGFLASSFHGFLRDSGPGQNADKTQTKCRQNHKCNFVNHSALTTYNLNALTCLNFPARPLSAADSRCIATESSHARALLYKTGQNGTISSPFRNRSRCTNDLQRHRGRSSRFGSCVYLRSLWLSLSSESDGDGAPRRRSTARLTVHTPRCFHCPLSL